MWRSGLHSVLIVVVVILVVVHVVVEMVLLRVSVLRVAVELSCSPRSPWCVGGGSAQADPPRKRRCWDGGVLWPACDRVLLELRPLVWVVGWRETRGASGT